MRTRRRGERGAHGVMAGTMMASTALPVCAGDVSILAAEFSRTAPGRWDVAVTLAHEDSGWEHHADARRVVAADGTVLGTRTLLHPHETEQPFTRALSGVSIPDPATRVHVEAHDKVHGWSARRLDVDLSRANSGRFRVGR